MPLPIAFAVQICTAMMVRARTSTRSPKIRRPGLAGFVASHGPDSRPGPKGVYGVRPASVLPCDCECDCVCGSTAADLDVIWVVNETATAYSDRRSKVGYTIYCWDGACRMHHQAVAVRTRSNLEGKAKFARWCGDACLGCLLLSP